MRRGSSRCSRPPTSPTRATRRRTTCVTAAPASAAPPGRRTARTPPAMAARPPSPRPRTAAAGKPARRRSPRRRRSRDKAPAHLRPVPRRPDAEPRVEPPAGQDVHGRQVLGQPQRVLPAQRDHRRPKLDPRRALRGGGEHGDGGGDPVLQVPVAHPGGVKPKPFAKLDHLKRHLVPRPRILPVEQPDRQKPKLLQGNTRLRHALPFSKFGKNKAIPNGFVAPRGPAPSSRGRFGALFACEQPAIAKTTVGPSPRRERAARHRGTVHGGWPLPGRLDDQDRWAALGPANNTALHPKSVNPLAYCCGYRPRWEGVEWRSPNRSR